VNAEIEFFRARNSAVKRPVLAAILSGNPGSGGDATECFPPALAPGEPQLDRPFPLAADLRPGREKGKDAELRLIAEWLDIGAQYYNDPFVAPVAN